MAEFAFGIQPNKEGQFILYRDGREVAAYPTSQAALNAVILEARSKLSAANERWAGAELALNDWKARAEKAEAENRILESFGADAIATMRMFIMRPAIFDFLIEEMLAWRPRWIAHPRAALKKGGE